MMFLTALALLAAPLLVTAQYGGGGAATTTAPAAASVTVPPDTDGRINVGVGPGLSFSRPNFTASNNTIVTFYILSSKHSVTQSSFAAPCTPLAANGSAPAGFDSGVTSDKQFTITITNDQRPIWFFCKQGKHCGQGMVGAINAPSTGNTFQSFSEAALAIGSSQNTIQDNGPVTGGVNAQATAAPAATATGAAAAAPSGSGANGLGVSAGAAILALIVAFISA